MTSGGRGGPGWSPPQGGAEQAIRYSPAQLARLLGTREPTAEQAAVIAAPLAPMAVIAGAGSGKSETMAARLVWLVANDLIQPDRVLGLTFTRKAAGELSARVEARLAALYRAGIVKPAERDLDPQAGDPLISTYHAYAGRLVAEHALRMGLEPSLRLITPAVAWQLASRVVAAYDGPLDELDWTPATVTAAVIELAGQLDEHLREPQDVIETGRWLDRCQAALADEQGRLPARVRTVLARQRAREQLLPMVSAFAAAKAGREVIDYADQMATAARIAAAHPEVGRGERARFQLVLLDEFQDTSHAQLVLLRSLFGGGHPVTAVGDPCQSIYGWRGASAGNLRRFSTDFRAAGGEPAEVRLLATSFRNAGSVLAAAAAIQAGLRAAAPEVPVLEAPPERAARGHVRCALLDTPAAEAAWIAGEIGELLSLPPGIAPDGRPWPDQRPAGVRPSDIAVLCRRRTQFPALRAALEAAEIPVEVVGLGGLLTVPEVADIVATLRVMYDPTASDALARLLTSPRWRIGPADLMALGRRARALARDAAGQRNTGDLVDRTVSELTADVGSLIEALDDLGAAAAYSAEGHIRLSALAAELRVLRGHAGRPLAELVAEVERSLNLDIEVAARPGVDHAAARADLDAFADAAAAFAGDQEEPTLGAFLAYLVAAEEEEFGLEAGRVGDSDSVKLATVHAAKGLEWAAVFVPGLAGGTHGHVFPAKPRVTTRWTDNPRLLPFGLRGDAVDLPVLAGLSADELTEFTRACTERELAEERRLGYVAATRAAFWLGCSGYWWGDGVSRLGPSQFLTEICAACAEGAGDIQEWAAEPEPDAANPALAEPAEAWWPAEVAADARHSAVRAAGELVDQAIAAQSSAVQATPADAGVHLAGGTQGELFASGRGKDDDQQLIEAWIADADLLLAERARRRRGDGLEVVLPRRLPVSALVTMARDQAELARQVRRPMPRPPAPAASRGTEFHQWLEQRLGQTQLIDADDLPGAADDAEAAAARAGSDAGQAELAELRARFAAGRWADRLPVEVEVPFETLIGDRVVSGRIDAVFADSDGGYDVVDWKTGKVPGTKAERRAVAVQLAAYRLAWAALAGVPVESVHAAFYYVRDDVTVRPADLLDAEGLTALLAGIPLAAQA